MAGALKLTSYGNKREEAEAIANMYESWNSARQVWLKRVREVLQYVYATSTRETANAGVGGEGSGWSHSTHIPKLTQIHDNLGANYVSALLGGRNYFTFEPATVSEDTVGKRKAVVNYLLTKHDYSGFESTLRKLLDDWVQTGNCFGFIEYVVETTDDPLTKMPIVVYEGPKLRRISPFDIVFDHTAEDFNKTAKIFRKVLSTSELMRQVEERKGVDYDMAELEELYTCREQAKGMRALDINKQIQWNFDGFNAAAHMQGDTIELLEFIGDIYNPYTKELEKDMLITVADRSFVIRKQRTADLGNVGQIYHCGWRKRPDNLWAQGPLDNLVGMQYLINHLENARADAFDQMLSPDRVHVGNVQMERNGPVTNYYVDDANGNVYNLAPDATALQADFQIQTKEAQMEAYAGAPREAMGIRSAGEKTAFEVQTLQNAASRMFQKCIEQFEREFLEPVLNGELELAVRNLQGADVAKVIDDDEGVMEFMSITAEDLSSRGKLKARGASHYAKRAQLVQELQQFNNILLGDQAMSVHFPAKLRAKAWAEALQLDRLNLYVPFGQIDENIEAQQAQQAAAQVMDEYTAAEQGLAEGPVPLSGSVNPDVMTRVEVRQ